MSSPNSWRHIATTVLGSNSASVFFQNLDTTYRRWLLSMYIVKDANAGEVFLRFNNDSGTNYEYQRLNVLGTTVSGARTTGAAQIAVTTGEAIAANSVGLFVITVSKPVAGEVARVTEIGGSFANLATDAIIFQSLVGAWTNTADLISTINILVAPNNFAAGTRVDLFGSK